MSWIAPILNRYLLWTEKPHMRRAVRPEDLRRSFETKARLFFHAPFGTERAEVDLGPGRAITLSPRGGAAGPILLYFHGGGYIFGSPRTHAAMLATLVKRTGGKAILPWYPLAPEAPYPAAPDAARAFYDAVRAAHPDTPVFVGGDSAGGALALTLLSRLVRDGAPLPSGLFAFSPLTDLTYSSVSMTENAASDVVLPAERATDMAAMYLNGADPKDPDISPLYADFTGAPPVWITVGDTEILYDDSRQMVDRLQAQSVDVTYVEERDLPHVWPIFHNMLPEARRTLDLVADWIGDHTEIRDPTR